MGFFFSGTRGQEILGAPNRSVSAVSGGPKRLECLLGFDQKDGLGSAASKKLACRLNKVWKQKARIWPFPVDPPWNDKDPHPPTHLHAACSLLSFDPGRDPKRPLHAVTQERRSWASHHVMVAWR